MQFKAISRRLSGAKSRGINAEMQPKTPKLHLAEFRNTLKIAVLDCEEYQAPEETAGFPAYQQDLQSKA